MDHLCMPPVPEWNKFDMKNDSYAYSWVRIVLQIFECHLLFHALIGRRLASRFMYIMIMCRHISRTQLFHATYTVKMDYDLQLVESRTGQAMSIAKLMIKRLTPTNLELSFHKLSIYSVSHKVDNSTFVWIIA